MKKILFCITKGNFGGAQRYVYDLATNLPKEDFEAVVACGEGEALPKLLTEKNIRTIKIEKLEREVKTFTEFKVCKNLVEIFRKEKPDIIHLNSSKVGGVGAVAGRIASKLEKDYNPEIIFTSHGWGFYETHRSIFEKIFYYISHYITILLCHKTIAVSEKTKQDIAWLPFIKNKITVVHNGIESFKMLIKKEAHQILVGDESDKRTIVFTLAELHKNKGIDVALKGISLLPENSKEKMLFVVAGAGEEKENLEKLIKDLNIENQVKLLGFVENGKKLLSGANIFLFPSRTENLPYAILEAGLAGLPIISTGVGGIPEIIDDMRNGILIHRNNPKEIAEAILYLLNNKDKQKEFGAEIKSTVSNFFSFQKMISETIALYQ